METTTKAQESQELWFVSPAICFTYIDFTLSVLPHFGFDVRGAERAVWCFLVFCGFCVYVCVRARVCVCACKRFESMSCVFEKSFERKLGHYLADEKTETARSQDKIPVEVDVKFATDFWGFRISL